MIVDDIKNRMRLAGITNAQLAKSTGSTPAQLSLFFKGEGASLKTHVLQQCLDELSIDTAIYTRRYNLALVVAEKLKEKYEIQDVANFTKQEMADEAANTTVLQFIDVDAKEFAQIRKDGVIDIESTFPFFKTMVLQLMSTGTQSTKSAINTSWTSIAIAIGLLPLLGGISAIGLGLGFALGAFFKVPVSSFSDSKKAIFPLIGITEFMLNKKKK